MEKRIGTLWTYDMVLNHLTSEEEAFSSEQRRILGMLGNLGITQSDLLAARNAPVRVVLPENGSQATLRLLSCYDLISTKVDITRALLGNTKKAKPILMGPATLDSLLHSEPDRYDYIICEHLPFRNMFFEFLDPVSIKMPFQASEHKLCGIHLYTSDLVDNRNDNGENKYLLEVYYKDHKDRTRYMMMSCNPATKEAFRGSVPSIKFHADMGSRTVKYTRIEDVHEEQKNGIYVNPFYSDGYSNSCTLEEADGNGFFVRMANLCTNTINYINARNKEVIERKREVMVKSRDKNNGKARRKAVSEPYYLIKINDAARYAESEHTGTTWELKKRVYVIGHDRKYRDEDGNIKKIIYIDPFIKGPPDAPWGDQRYEILYGQLQRERQMLDRGQRFN